MHRRRILGLGAAAAVGFAGYGWTRMDRDTSALDTDPDETDTPTPTAGGNARKLTNSTTIGGTLNGRPRILGDNFGLLEDSKTSWIHAFLDVRGKYENGGTPIDDRDVKVLRRVATETETSIAINLLWDFKGTFGNKDTVNVPDPGSKREGALFEYATKLLRAIDHPPEIIVLGNEPMWETPEEDVHGRDLAIVPFTRNLKDHLVEHYQTDNSKLLVGSLNRLHDGFLERYFPHLRREFFDMARNDDDIDGIDLHVHFQKTENAEEMIATAREEVPDGIITTTEFSPAGRYNEHKDTPIAQSEPGKQFASRYDHPEDMTVQEYFELAIDQPRPSTEIADFYAAMPWYNVGFVEDMWQLLKKYDVSVGFTLFMLGPGLGNTNWPRVWTPYPLNGLYQGPLITTENGAHPHYLSDYRIRAEDE